MITAVSKVLHRDREMNFEKVFVSVNTIIIQTYLLFRIIHINMHAVLRLI